MSKACLMSFPPRSRFCLTGAMLRLSFGLSGRRSSPCWSSSTLPICREYGVRTRRSAGFTNFFNSGEERKKMRDESQTPRNSRELAVRNQFFTPRYVVQFLVDNTLGRLWLEMHRHGGLLAAHCDYLVRSEDELANARPQKDPRDLHILDPACGSGHFLLYSFDLLLAIYEEAWSAEGAAPVSDVTGHSLRSDFPDLDDLRRAAPRMIVEYNLHGVDIDPRCAQIAALALWLRAQRAWKEIGVAAADRPRIHRTHIVVAEPMPGDAALTDEFAAQLDPPLLRDLFQEDGGGKPVGRRPRHASTARRQHRCGTTSSQGRIRKTASDYRVSPRHGADGDAGIS